MKTKTQRPEEQIILLAFKFSKAVSLYFEGKYKFLIFLNP